MNKENGRCQDVRPALGAAGPSPIVVEEAPKVMCGEQITSRMIEEVSQIAQKMAHPVDNTASSPRYRKEMVRVLTQEAMHEALDRAKNAQGFEAHLLQEDIIDGADGI